MTEKGRLSREELEDLKNRLGHLADIAEIVQRVEADEGNSGESKSLKQLEDELRGHEDKLEDAIGSSEEHERELVLEVVADMRDLDERLTKEIEQAVVQESRAIGHELRDIAEAYK
ncbi:MAG: hypothetical protein ABEJ36_06355 [Candidatus Nanosalina sp.]